MGLFRYIMNAADKYMRDLFFFYIGWQGFEEGKEKE